MHSSDLDTSSTTPSYSNLSPICCIYFYNTYLNFTIVIEWQIPQHEAVQPARIYYYLLSPFGNKSFKYAHLTCPCTTALVLNQR